MDRMTFIGQTTQGKPLSVDDIISYFDHTMAAYELVQGVDDLRVMDSTPDSIHSSLKLQIQSPHTSELDSVVNYINETLHNRKDLYGRSFSINAIIQNSCVELSVNDETVYT